MTLDKAIELLKTASEGWPTRDNEDYYKALDLGIEALKSIKGLREQFPQIIIFALPGETENRQGG